METEIIDPMLDIQEPIYHNEGIEKYIYKKISLQTRANLNEDNAQLNFEVEATDNYFVPSKSHLLITGRLLQANNQPINPNHEISLINNAMMYLFKSIEFTIGGTTMELLRYPGQTTSILGYLSYPDDFNSTAGLKICWSKDRTNNALSSKYVPSQAVAANAAIAAGDLTPTEQATYNEGFAIRKTFINSSNPVGTFSFLIPFCHMFGFADYDKYLYNVKQSLTLTRGPDT